MTTLNLDSALPVEVGFNEPLFRDLVEKSLVGIYVIQDDRFTYANPKLAEIFGYTVDELLALASYVEVVAEPDRPMATELMRRRLNGEEAHCRGIHPCLHGLR